MKTTFKFISLVLCSVFVLALFSFTKNQMSFSGKAYKGGKSTQMANPNSSVLLSDGISSLIYTQDGTLVKAVSALHGETRYTKTIENGEITYTATAYNNGIVAGRFTYKVNSAGLTSNIISEQFDNGKPWLSWSDSCIYNEAGQLIKQINGNGHYDYIYDDNGDVSKIKYYNYQNKLIRDIAIRYTVDSSPLIADRNNLVPEDVELDLHLQIFGKFSNHLPKQVDYMDYATGGEKTSVSYNYVLNEKGLIQSRNKIATGSDQVIKRSFVYRS